MIAASGLPQAYGRTLTVAPLGSRSSTAAKLVKVAPFVIIGDKGFGLKPYLLRPSTAAELKDPETMFNYR